MPPAHLDHLAPGQDRLARPVPFGPRSRAANALRHTPSGGRVWLSASRDAGAVVLAVRDTGSGIPAGHLPYVFDRFYKADTARSDAGGTGLGLSIVKAIVERHGGTLRVTSTPGMATCFEVRLPV